MERFKLPPEWWPDEHVFAFHEDSNANAVLITKEGELFAVAEERLSRKRFQAGFPKKSLEWLEEASKVEIDSVSTLVFGNRTHFLPRILGSLFPTFEHDMFGFSHKLMVFFHHLCFVSPMFLNIMASINRAILKLRFKKKSVLVDHHFAHAASAYFCSGKNSACAVSADNFGDGYSVKVFDCEGSNIRFLYGTSAMHSPGQFYGEIAQIAGIHPLLAGKLTGMAAGGNPNAAQQEMQTLFDTTPDEKNFTKTFGWLRSKRSNLFSRLKSIPTKDVAASAQKQFEDVMVKFVHRAIRQTNRRNLVLAGGSFGNVRLNQRLLELPEVDFIYIHPAMSDQGIALGAALAYIASLKNPEPFFLKTVLLGPEPTEDEMLQALSESNLPYTRPADIAKEAGRLLAQGKILARFDGALEYGPRALGNRSILYHTQDKNVQSWLNKKLRRAEYMPFAPVTLASHASKCYLNIEGGLDAARFMTISFYATEWMKQVSPGVVHIDGTVRPQILHEEDNFGMYRILEEYMKLTGIPSLLNTSFNMHEEPIVATPKDAVRAFLAAELDYMIMGPFLVKNPAL